MELIHNIESYYRESYNEEELTWIKKDIMSISVEQYDYFFNKLREKYANLPKPAKIVKLLYELEFKKSAQKNVGERHSCGKCDSGLIYVFDILKYKSICLEMGKDLKDLCELDLCRCGVNCMDLDEKGSIDIHTYLKKIQNIDDRQFQYAYISLYQFYLRSSKTSLTFDKWSPYNFWGIKEILKPLFLKDILNKEIKNELVEQENYKIDVVSTKDEFEEFLDDANKEANNRRLKCT